MIINKLIIRNLKKFEEETFEFSNLDLIVGGNNSGKSTILQAMAIWQFCVEEFRRVHRKGKTGIQIVLPNFSALPVPEFNLLWHNRTERSYNESKKLKLITIEIILFWRNDDGEEKNFGISMRYHTPQSIYAIPIDGWDNFKKLSKMPRIVYVPPFSGLEPNEIWYDDAIIRKNVGKAQPGSVLRNLLFRVVDKKESIKENKEWQEIVKLIDDWFGVSLNPPEYTKGISTEIKLNYTINKKDYDIISGGSGFHQILTLLAFIYGYPDLTTILFDEPDAHLHVKLQQQLVGYFRQLPKLQFIIATHSEEFIKGVGIHSIVSVLDGKPKKVQSNKQV